MLAWLVCWALHICALPLPCLSLQMLCPERMYAVIVGASLCVSKETDAQLEQQLLSSRDLYVPWQGSHEGIMRSKPSVPESYPDVP